jgi:hypothetical protein
MNRTTKLLLVAMAVATATISAPRAGSTLQSEERTTASSDPTRFSLTVENGTPNGNFEAGTLVIVSADAPQAGAQFTGWTGDVAILANPFIPTTTATIPYMAVTIAATYTEPAVNPILILDAILDCLWGG